MHVAADTSRPSFASDKLLTRLSREGLRDKTGWSSKKEKLLAKMARVITKSDVERMRSSIFAVSDVELKRMNRKAELKQLSTNRVEHWPTTAEANKMRKAPYAIDHEAQNELEQVLVDQQVRHSHFFCTDYGDLINYGSNFIGGRNPTTVAAGVS